MNSGYIEIYGGSTMTRLPLEIKEKAIKLREKGFSLREISLKLKIAKSTASLWLSDLELNLQAKERLKRLGIIGSYKTSLTKRRKREKLLSELESRARFEISNLRKEKELYKLLCSIMFWCEGNKQFGAGIRFTNSDPEMIKTFLKFLRKGFDLDEKKFRALIHLHEYHDKETQIEFWSKVTNIPKEQFNKCYLKPHTGKREKEGYPGCLALYYFDSKVARELWAYYQSAKKYI